MGPNVRCLDNSIKFWVIDDFFAGAQIDVKDGVE
jgi:hypothetical protein